VTATSQAVLSFKAHIPEFSSLSDADVAAALDEADMWLDESKWDAKDFPWARMWLAAHTLKLAESYAGAGAAAGSSSAGSVGTFVRSISFGERRVMFGERKFTSSKTSVTSAGEELLEDTIYGMKYLRLRNRNFPGVLTV
jgi:Protein of unknown function (DUF4054)